MSEITVLLVDDEEDFVTVLAERLQRRGLVVDTAQSGETALEKAGGHVFDAVVLDMAMPGMDGVETLRGLLEINKDLQVILLTGHSTIHQAVEAMKLGALDLLEKPADIEVLVAKIDDAARRKTKLDDRRIEQRISDIMRQKGW
ncbi:MAG: response regulator [Gemmatimonadota bacterium]|nr:MAG: response regulator [Gemmatimonadota bacterium]